MIDEGDFVEQLNRIKNEDQVLVEIADITELSLQGHLFDEDFE